MEKQSSFSDKKGSELRSGAPTGFAWGRSRATHAILMAISAILLTACDGKHPGTAHSPPHRSSPPSAAVAAPSEIDKLLGASCYSAEASSSPVCQRGEAEGEPKKDSAATAAFTHIFWSRMDESARADAVQRMDVIAPFSEKARGIVTGFGCVAHDCENNNVNFYYERSSGRIAFTIVRDLNCQEYLEDGFKSKNLLCRG